MGFLKKIVFGITACILILWGGAGTQSSSILMQGGGFIGLIIGLVVLYLFLRMAWRAVGCLPSLLIFLGIAVFILYAIGAFRDGPSGILRNLKGFLGQSTMSGVSEQASADAAQTGGGEPLTIGEGFSSAPAPAEGAGTFEKLMGAIEGKPSAKQASANNVWQQLPVIRSSVKVVTGDTVKIDNAYFKIYGVSAPALNQNCSDGHGRAYGCGRQSAAWLSDWILDSEIECRVMSQNAKGNMIGTCTFGPYDIGAALVNAGWGLANTRQTDIYLPYEQQAKDARRGLWQGQFYRPEDWRKAQKMKPKIKIIEQKEKNPHAFFSF